MYFKIIGNLNLHDQMAMYRSLFQLHLNFIGKAYVKEVFQISQGISFSITAEMEKKLNQDLNGLISLFENKEIESFELD